MRPRCWGGWESADGPSAAPQFLGDFQPVSIKMAKEQGLSLNPTKISGSCGRLMCCLKYEQDTYEELLRSTPKVGAIVTSKEGKGDGAGSQSAHRRHQGAAGQKPRFPAGGA